MAHNGDKTQFLQLMTWSIWGLNDNRKVRKITAYLKRHKVDIAVLQETHLQPDSSVAVQCRMQSQCYAADYTSHARGVLLWVDRRSGVTMTGLLKDLNGRYSEAKCSKGDLNFIGGYLRTEP